MILLDTSSFQDLARVTAVEARLAGCGETGDGGRSRHLKQYLKQLVLERVRGGCLARQMTVLKSRTMASPLGTSLQERRVAAAIALWELHKTPLTVVRL